MPSSRRKSYPATFSPSPIRVVGRKRFFHRHAFNETAAALLATGLLGIVARGAATVFASPFGTKYVVEGEVPTPHGHRVRVATVWIIEPPDTRPRLVTAYPV